MMRNWKRLCCLLAAAALLPQAGACLLEPVPLDQQVSTFIVDFTRQVLAAALL